MSKYEIRTAVLATLLMFTIASAWGVTLIQWAVKS